MEDRLWKRQDGEPALWHNRFEVFRLLGAGRTIEDAWRKSRGAAASRKRPGSAWFKRSAQWHWLDRCAAWDAEQVALQEQELAAARAEWKGKERRMAEQLIEKATQMLAFPVAQRRVETATGVTIVEPGDWRFADVARIADVASKLARLAMEMVTSKTGVELGGTEQDLAKLLAERDSAIAERNRKLRGEGRAEDTLAESLPE
jgi:hypothetical protein